MKSGDRQFPRHMQVGVHVSIAGGFSLAIRRAFDLGCTCMQIFSRNPRSWQVKPVDPDDLSTFRKLRARWGIGPLLVHTGYLINLASQQADMYEKSMEQFVVDLKRAELLGADYLVTHLGSARGRDAAWMTDRVSEALNQAMKLHPPSLTILLENTAGRSGEVGYTLEQIQLLISRIRNPARVGVCYDTCHGFAAGYDMRTKKDVDILAKRIEATVGLQRIKSMHLNDCVKDFNSRTDRHWHIGDGSIGLTGFRTLLNHPSFRAIPKILETPKKTARDDMRNMSVVASLIRRT